MSSLNQIEKHLPLRVFGILFMTFWIFLPSLNNGFVAWDDPAYILSNPLIRELSLSNLKKIFTTFLVGNYQPLTILSFGIEYHFAGLNPKVFHATNVVLHMMNVLLAFYFAKKFSRDTLVALVVALLFGIHPLRVESVAWATERKDVLFAFFYLCSLIFYTRYVDGKRQNIKLYLSTALFFILSALSKPAAVSLPVVLFFIDYYKGSPVFDRRSLQQKIPLLLVSIGFGITALYATILPFESPFPWKPDFSFGERIVLTGAALMSYLGKLFFPLKLSSFYPYPERINHLFPASVYVLAAMTVVLGGIVWRYYRKNKTVVFGLAFFVTTIFFNLPIFGQGFTFITDRFTYIPFVGLFVIVGEVVSFLYQKLPKNNIWAQRRFWSILFILVFILCFITWFRCRVWKNTLTLWNDVIRKYPNVAMAYSNRAMFFVQHNRLDWAIKDYSKAVELMPYYYSALGNRANMYFLKGQHDLALADYNRAIEINPQYINGYFNRAAYYQFMKQFDEALADYDMILILKPGHKAALKERSLLLQRKTNFKNSQKE